MTSPSLMRNPLTLARRPRSVSGWRRAGAVALALLMLLLLGAPPRVVAEPAVRATTQWTHAFSRQLTFRATLESDDPIDEVILFYGVVDKPVVRRIYPEVSGSMPASVAHTEELEPGQFAPGTELRAWYQVVLETGEVVTTPEERLLYVDEALQWEELVSDRVTLYWHGRAQAQAEDLLAAAEEVIDRLAAEMGVPPPDAVAIWVYNNERDMARATSTRSESYDARVTTLGMAMDGGTLLLLGSHRDVRRTLAHELCHVVVGLATDNPYIEIPRWLDEGLAMNAEGELPRDNQRALQTAIARDSLLTLRSMTSYSGDPQLVNLYYGQAYSIVAFMLETYGRETMQELLAVFAEGQRQDVALERVLGFGLDELESRWRVSLGLDPLEPVGVDLSRTMGQSSAAVVSSPLLDYSRYPLGAMGRLP